MIEPPLIVIADINVLLPLLFGKTRRAKYLRDAWQGLRFRLVLTQQILQELNRVITYPKVFSNYGLDDTTVAENIQTLQETAFVLPGDYSDVNVMVEDSTDNIYLAAALESGADYLVTQDRHILSLKYFYGTQIISLSQFVEMLE